MKSLLCFRILKEKYFHPYSSFRFVCFQKGCQSIACFDTTLGRHLHSGNCNTRPSDRRGHLHIHTSYSSVYTGKSLHLTQRGTNCYRGLTPNLYDILNLEVKTLFQSNSFTYLLLSMLL